MSAFCPACGTPTDQGAAICDGCGLVFVSFGASTPVPVPTVAPPTDLPATLHCPHCGRALLASVGSPFCGHGLPTLASLAVGRVVARRYRVTSQLARGGMGLLYLAADESKSDQAVVLKVIEQGRSSLSAREARDLLQREGSILLQLDHPALPRLIDQIFERQLTGLALSYIPGRSLEQDLAPALPAGATIALRPYPRETVMRWGAALCRVLTLLEQHPGGPIMHCDIKPANILFDQARDMLALIDFGIAQHYNPAAPPQAAYGTIGYAPPEQHRGQPQPRSDVYALAATLYHLLTGDDPSDHPFHFPQIGELHTLGWVLSMALRPDPDERISAAQLGYKLERLLGLAGDALLHTPQGAPIADRAALVAWCIEHWPDAAGWLYGLLPDHVALYWGDAALAERLRFARRAIDHEEGLDAALTEIDPEGYGARPRRVVVTPASIDLRPALGDTTLQRAVTIDNRAGRLIRIDLPHNDWMRFQPARLSLPPGTTLTPDLIVDVGHLTLTGPKSYRLTLGDPDSPSFALRVAYSLDRQLVRRRLTPYAIAATIALFAIALMAASLMIQRAGA